MLLRCNATNPCPHGTCGGEIKCNASGICSSGIDTKHQPPVDGAVCVKGRLPNGPRGPQQYITGGLEVHLNFESSVVGLVFVELQDESGEPIPGHAMAEADPLRGNFVAKAATWRGGSSTLLGLAGRTVRFRLAMVDASLFSVEVRCAGLPAAKTDDPTREAADASLRRPTRAELRRWSPAQLRSWAAMEMTHGLPCPCAAALCRPLHPQPRFTHEAVPFITNEAMGGNGSEFADFDYGKISAVGNDQGGGPGSQPVWGHALCTAHAHGVRALPNIAAVGLWPPTVANSGLDHSSGQLWWANETAISTWVGNAVPSLQRQGYDGAFLDLEEPMPNASVVRGMRSLVCQLKRALNRTIPGSVVMWSMELLPSGGAGPGEIAASHCLDTILLMGYGADPALPPWNTSLPICKAHPEKCAHLATHGVEPWDPKGSKYNDPASAAGQ